MKQITTIMCCFLFLCSGILVIGHTKDRDGPSLFPGNATAYATPQLKMPSFPVNNLPLDLQLDLNKGAKTDTVFVKDTVYQVKYKTKKVYQAAVPDTVEVYDTLCVPIFYITKPLEHEIESTEIRVINDVHIDCQSGTNQIDSININD